MLKDRMWLLLHRAIWQAANRLRVAMVRMRMPARLVNRVSHICWNAYVECMFE